MKLTWLGHSSVRIDAANQVIYIDPYAGENYTTASIVLISRADFDHLSMQKLANIRGDKTLVVGPNAVVRQTYPSRLLKVGERIMHEGVEIIGMPVLQAHEDTELHEKEDALGFLIIAENKRVYFMGDSDYESEMQKARPDVLLIAVGGTFSAGPKEAAVIATKLQAKLAIPIHWGKHAGTIDDADVFQESARVPVKILQPNQSVTI